ncbi:MAG: DsbA family protein, partial [Chitinivibrionales bacterium]
AGSIGISKRYFETLIESSGVKDLLDSSSAEARRNRVKVTPTFFINGKRYRSYKDPEWVVDAALFEYKQLEE